MAVRVVTDSTSDLTPELAEELGITVVPASVHFGTQVYRDGVDLSTDEFFEKLFEGPDFPTTSQPSIGEFIEKYTGVADGADGIVSVHVSSKVSGTFNSAQQGAQQAAVDCPIEVLDTLQASMGIGMVAIAAAKAAQAGASMEEVTAVANNAIGRCQCIALLDTLEYLERGGRIGKARAVLGSLLRIKPVIIVQDGEVHDLAKERTRRKGIARLRRTAEQFSPLATAAVTYSTVRDEAVELAESLRPLMEGSEAPMVVRFGPALGTYVGPNSLGICLMSAGEQP
jgi:DegV family protein with EDD domain